MNQKIKAKLQKMIAEIEAAERSGRKFEDLNVLGEIKNALTEENEEKLRAIWSESFENGNTTSANSFWHYSEEGEEFWQVLQEFLYPHKCPECDSVQTKKEEGKDDFLSRKLDEGEPAKKANQMTKQEYRCLDCNHRWEEDLIWRRK